MNSKSPKVVNNLDRTIAYVRFLHGDRKRQHSRAPQWMYLTSVAELVLDSGGSEEAAIIALLHRVFIESLATLADFDKFIDVLTCDKEAVKAGVQTLTMAMVHIDPTEMLISFVTKGNAPIDTIIVYLAIQYINYGYKERNYVGVSDGRYHVITKIVSSFVSTFDNDIVTELAALLGDRIDTIRAFPKVLQRKEALVNV